MLRGRKGRSVPAPKQDRETTNVGCFMQQRVNAARYLDGIPQAGACPVGAASALIRDGTTRDTTAESGKKRRESSLTARWKTDGCVRTSYIYPHRTAWHRASNTMVRTAGCSARGKKSLATQHEKQVPRPRPHKPPPNHHVHAVPASLIKQTKSVARLLAQRTDGEIPSLSQNA